MKYSIYVGDRIMPTSPSSISFSSVGGGEYTELCNGDHFVNFGAAPPDVISASLLLPFTPDKCDYIDGDFLTPDEMVGEIIGSSNEIFMLTIIGFDGDELLFDFCADVTLTEVTASSKDNGISLSMKFKRFAGGRS